MQIKDDILYRVGSNNILPTCLILPTNSDINRNCLIARWIEFWCDQNCIGEWRVVQYLHYIEVSFEQDTDAMIFKLSSEYSIN